MRYFLFNKKMDYDRGRYANLLVRAGCIQAENPAPGRPGIFLSRILDSREEGTVWHRMVMEAACGDNMAVYLKIYAADTITAAGFGWECCQASWLGEAGSEGKESADGAKMQAVLESFLCLEARNPEDILLHQVKGRYLWLVLVLHGNGEAGPAIRGMKLYFPRETWMRFLPEIYQGENGGFLERYLCIFQSIYDSLGEKIRGDAAYLDIKTANPELLLWLSGWLCAGNSHLWKPENLKQYLEPGAMAYRNLGTPGALVKMVELYTGFTPCLKESGPGEDPHLFHLYIMEEAVASPRQYQALLRVIREGKPADMEVQVIALKSFVFLDQDTYLGINSVLNQYGQAVLDNGSSIPYAVLGGREA